MIEKINSKSRNSEFDTLNTRITKVYQDSNLKDDTYLPSIFKLLKPISIQFAEAVDRQKEESELSEKDEIRDNAGRKFYYLVSGYIHHPDKEISEAAKKVMNVFDHYGLEIFSMSYAIESSKINSLLLHLEEPEIKDSIANLSGITEVLTELKQSQKEFENVYLHHQKAKSQSNNEDNATELRKELINILNGKLIPYLNGVYGVDPEKYGSFVHEISAHISSNNSNVKTRAKRLKAEAPVQ